MDITAPYLAYVASAYGLFAIVLVGLLVSVIWRGVNLKRQLQARGLNDPGQGEA